LDVARIEQLRDALCERRKGIAQLLRSFHNPRDSAKSVFVEQMRALDCARRVLKRHAARGMLVCPQKLLPPAKDDAAEASAATTARRARA
jgi:hypothetical protein